MKLLLPLLACLLLVVSAVALLEFGDSQAVLEVERREVASERAVAGSKLVEPEAKRVAEEAVVEERTDAASSSAPAELFVSGTVIVTEPDGTQTRGLNGSANLVFYIDGSGTFVSGEDGRPFLPVDRRLRIPVTNGRWEARFILNEDGEYRLELPSEASGQLSRSCSTESLLISVLLLEAPRFEGDAGRLEVGDDKQPLGIGDEDVVVHFRRRDLFRISVKDARSGWELPSVTIFGVRDSRWGDLPPKTRQNLVVEQSPSPISIDPEASRWPANPGLRRGYQAFPDTETFFVGSPGYAWRVSTIRPTEGGNQEILLEPGGDLAIEFTGRKPPPAAELRIRNATRKSPIAQIPLASLDPLAFDGLILGEHQVSVEVGGGPFYLPLVLAKKTVHITRGEPTQVSLHIADPPDLWRAQVAGTVTVPLEWELPRFWISLSLQGVTLDGTSGHHMLSSAALELLPGSEDTYAFDFGEVQAGRYSLKLSPLSHGLLFDLHSSGAPNLSLAVPPPVDITVLLRDAESNTNAKADSLVWSSVRAPDARGLFLRRANRDPKNDRFHLRVPEGDFTVVSATNRYKPLSQTVSAVGGANFILDVEPTEKP